MIKVKRFFSGRSVKDVIFYCCLIVLPLTQFAIFYIGVNFRSILYVFQEYDGNGGYVFNGLNNFATVFRYIRAGELSYAFKNSLYLYLISLFIGMPLGILFSVYIYKNCKGSRFFRVVLFLPMVFPAVVMTFVFRGVTDSVLPAILKAIDPDSAFMGVMVEPSRAFAGIAIYAVWMGFGANVLLFVGAMTAIPDSVVEAAALDGCGAVQEFFHITLPYIWPTLSTFLVVGIGGFFTNQYNVYTFYGQNAPETANAIGYFLFARAEAATFYEYPTLATYGICFTLIAAPLALLAKRIFRSVGNQSY